VFWGFGVMKNKRIFVLCAIFFVSLMFSSGPSQITLTDIFSKDVVAIMPHSSKDIYTKQINNAALRGDDLRAIKHIMKEAVASWNKKLVEQQGQAASAVSTQQMPASAATQMKAENSLESSNKQKIRALESERNITLILGASDREKHIVGYQKQNPDEVVVGLTQVVTGAKDDPTVDFGQKGLLLDFNDLEQMNMLRPLSGRIGKIMFDFSTFKFVHWNMDMVKLIYALLKPGGMFLLEDILYSADPIYLDGATCNQKDLHQQFMDIPAFDKQEMQPYYYICVKNNIERVYLPTEELVKVLGFNYMDAASRKEFEKSTYLPHYNPHIKNLYDAYRQARLKLSKESQTEVNSKILQRVGFLVIIKRNQLYPTGNIHARGEFDYIEARKPALASIGSSCSK